MRISLGQKPRRCRELDRRARPLHIGKKAITTIMKTRGEQ
jgi:hypothetical protein